MTSHNSVAKSVRLQKEQHPDKFCSNPKCLYRTDEVFCPKHIRDRARYPVKLHDFNGQRFDVVDYSMVGENGVSLL